MRHFENGNMHMPKSLAAILKMATKSSPQLAPRSPSPAVATFYAPF